MSPNSADYMHKQTQHRYIIHTAKHPASTSSTITSVHSSIHAIHIINSTISPICGFVVGFLISIHSYSYRYGIAATTLCTIGNTMPSDHTRSFSTSHLQAAWYACHVRDLTKRTFVQL